MKRFALIFALVAVLALPFLLRPRVTTAEKADETLVIITSHNEAIRHEFGQAFREWYRQKTGRSIAVDWRVIGGTTEITRFLESEYVAAFQNHWRRKPGRPWSNEVQAAFANPHLSPGADPAADTPELAARREFLASKVGCGIDLVFGGGSQDYINLADAGRIVDSGILRLHPEWFRDDIIPATFTGEAYWDAQGRWVGDVMSSYGMLYNRDVLHRLGIEREPREWADLQDPKLVGEVAMCDPTKSSSIAKAFENLIQQQIYRRWDRLERETGRSRAALEAQALREGWLDGLRVVQRICANARYFTDTSQKPPIDVLQGNSAVGMCIDFYGRYQEEAAGRRGGARRLGFFSPPGGTGLSPDPIAMLRGAPNPQAALAFIEFTLSMEGQLLWNYQVGTPGGPRQYALRRLPIRKDYYTEERRRYRSDPDVAPYANGSQLTYNPRWTGGIFREMAFVVRVMCLDTHPELTAAWREIIRAGLPEEALAVMSDLSVLGYDNMQGRIKQALNSRDKVDEIRLAAELAAYFRAQYQHAAEIARASRR